jgi:hypothetical protein
MIFLTASLFIFSGSNAAVTIDKLKKEVCRCCFRNCIGEAAYISIFVTKL